MLGLDKTKTLDHARIVKSIHGSMTAATTLLVRNANMNGVGYALENIAFLAAISWDLFTSAQEVNLELQIIASQFSSYYC